MKKSILFGLISLMMVSIALAIPVTLNQQGVLRNASTGGLVSGIYEFNITLYNHSNDAVVYTENRSVNVTYGVWNYIIGETTPIPSAIFEMDNLYTKIKVGDEVLSRVNLTAVPYCHIANKSMHGGQNFSVDKSLFFVDTDNNKIGIGTKNPASRFTIKSNKSDEYVIRLISSVSGNLLGGFYESGANNAALLLKNSAGTTNTYFASSGNSYLIGGNLGVGTSLPNGKLHVVGDLWVDDDFYLGGSIFEVNTTTIVANGSMIPFLDNKYNISNATNRYANLWLANDGFINGSLGIGTVSLQSAADMELYRNGEDTELLIHEDAGTHESRLRVRSGTFDSYIGLNSSQMMDFYGGKGDSVAIHLHASDINTQLYLGTNSNIGIATRSPDIKLVINGSAKLLDNKNLTFGSGNDSQIVWSTEQAVVDTLLWGLNNVSKSLIFTTVVNNDLDHNHSAQANPSLFIHSDIETTGNQSQWMSLTHDQDNAVIDSGTDNILLDDTTRISGDIESGDNGLDQDAFTIQHNSTRIVFDSPLGDDFYYKGASVEFEENITMHSPNGTRFTCGVANDGTFACS